MAKTSRSYWEKRRARDLLALFKRTEERAEELRKLYYAASAETESDAMRVMKKFQIEHSLTEKEAYRIIEKATGVKSAISEMKKNPTSAELAAELDAPEYAARIRELQHVQDNVSKKVEELYKRTKKTTDETLEYIANETYYREIFAAQQRVGEAFPFDDIKAEDIEKVLRKNWSGKNYSERIWGNTQELADAVKNEMMFSLITGKSQSKMVQAIQARFGVGYSDAHRLIRTEACYVSNQIQLEVYKRTGVKEYVYSAILDERTSEICRELDGKRFKVSRAKVGVNYPPMHPWCRSTTVAVESETFIDKLKRKARELWGKIVEIPKTMKYNAWEKIYRFKKAKTDVGILSKEEVLERAAQFAKEMESKPENIVSDNGNVFKNFVNGKLGYDRLPKVLPSEEFDEMARGKDVLYRGFCDGDRPANEYIDEFKRGRYFAGERRTYGLGTYTTKRQWLAQRYASNDSSVARILIDDKARIVSYIDIAKEWESLGTRTTKKADRSTAHALLDDIGTYAAMKGYDAIDMAGFGNADYVIVLNRGVVMVEE